MLARRHGSWIRFEGVRLDWLVGSPPLLLGLMAM